MGYKILGEPFEVSGEVLGNPTGRLPYSQRVLNTQPDSLIQYLPFGEIIGSANAIDLSPEGNDAGYNTVTLEVPGIGDGHTAARLNGAAGFIDIYSAALNADFDGAEGTALIWGRVDIGVWTDGIIRFMAQLRVDGNNRLLIRKVNPNIIQFIRTGGAVAETLTLAGVSPITYFMAACTWSETDDEVRTYYMDDVNPFFEVGVATVLGAWAGNLVDAATVVGATNEAGGSVWDGDLAHWAVWNTPLTEEELFALSIR